MITTEKIQYRRMPEIAAQHDELWLCVSSIRPDKRGTLLCVPNIEWHPELSPSPQLLVDTQTHEANGTNDTVYYENEYAPRFLAEMTTPEAKNSLKELILRGSEGNDIAIACFCPDIERCHRKALLGLLQGATREMGLSNIVDRRLPDWSQYWDKYKRIAGITQPQTTKPVMAILGMAAKTGSQTDDAGRPEPITIPGDLTLARDCVIVHQVNCQDTIGAGVSGSLIDRWPILSERYHTMARRYPMPQSRFGLVLPTYVENDTIVCNVFSQFDYGNAARTKRVYTDTEKLIDGIRRTCRHYPDKTVCVPERIGCGLAGADWNDVRNQLATLPVCIVAYQRGIAPTLPTRAQIDERLARWGRTAPDWQGHNKEGSVHTPILHTP